MNFFSALGFLTLIPMPQKAFREDGRQILHFPLIGLLIGALLFLVNHICALFVYTEIRVLIDTLFLAVITGALHLDGLADSADGLFSHRTKEQKLEIMKDPRIGVMGTLAVIFILALKMAGLSGLKHPGNEIWLFIAPALARGSQVIGLVFMNYARDTGGKSQLFFQKGNYRLLVFILIPLALPFWLSLATGFIILTLFLTVNVLLLWFFHKQIGGITGDTLGAATEITEALVLVTAGTLIFNA